VDWSLLSCGRSGHVTYAPAEPAVASQLRAQTESGEAWRCLRCGAYVAGEPMTSGPAAEAPAVRRGKEVRSALILRLFAIERFLRALAVGALAFVVWRFEYSRETIEQAYDRERPLLRSLFHQLGFNIDNSKLVGLVNRALTLSPATIKLVAIGLAAYAVIEIVEGTGLWVAKRWGEYFAMVATSVGLPFEVYDLVHRLSSIGGILFAINLALVLYLVITKRLFGVRGGKRAYEARLRSESIMDEAIEAAAAGREDHEEHGEQTPEISEIPGVPGPGRSSPAPTDCRTPADQTTAPRNQTAAPPGQTTAPRNQTAAPPGQTPAPPGRRTPQQGQDVRG
jgi:uncharacterized membrane protein (DUF2068 family)